MALVQAILRLGAQPRAPDWDLGQAQRLPHPTMKMSYETQNRTLPFLLFICLRQSRAVIWDRDRIVNSR